MKTLRPLRKLALPALALLAACADPPVRTVGGERDAHGCIGSAGYAWCAREAMCVRPWVLAAEKGFAVIEEAFALYCRELSR